MAIVRRCLPLLAVAWLSFNSSAAEPSDKSAALAVFQQRIMPIFRSPHPSSCVQCHLSSVDLKDYIRPSHQQTFVALRDQGLIDLEHPEQSKILDLIAMGERDLDKAAQLIHKRVRDAEYQAFAAWIDACCADPDLRSLPAATSSDPVGPAKPEVVIRHARKDRLLDSFVRNVWSQRMRCYPCHTPHELGAGEAPAEPSAQKYAAMLQQYGSRINLFRESPAATMKQFIDSSRSPSKRHLPLINVAAPHQSLLVLKPTSKLPAKTADGQPGVPSSVIPVTHAGGLKMHVDDQSYKSFLAWIQDYAHVVQGTYDDAEDLPADNWYPSGHVLRVSETPEAWAAMTTVQLFVHGWDEQRRRWRESADAFTQGTVTPRRFVNGSLFLLRAEASATAHPARLAPGKYLVRVYLDRDERVKRDPTVLLNDRAADGEAIVDARWGEGFREAEIIPGHQFQ